MKITQLESGPARYTPHCCDCGSMQKKFDDIQHSAHCDQIAYEQEWKQPCRVCEAEVAWFHGNNPDCMGHLDDV